MTGEPQRWDRYAIAAEVKRRGSSLKRLSVEAGLSESACRVALRIPFPSAEQAIANFLRLPLHVLWPDRHTPPRSREPKPSRTALPATSPNRNAA